MRNDKLIPGIILISIGGIFLLRSLGLVQFHFSNILHLWPIFLIIGGVNLIFAHNRSAWATTLKIGVIVGGVFLLLFGNFGDRYNFWPAYVFRNHHWNADVDDDNDNSDEDHATITKMDGNSTFTEAYHPEARLARLNITGGATYYKLSDTTNQQFEAFTKESNERYELSRKMEDSVYVLNFDMKKNSHFNWDNKHDNVATLKLNPNPEWEFNIEAGAAKLEFDLTKFKVRSLQISGGAASFNVKLGEPVATTNVDISTGAAEVKIDVPKGTACSITTDSGLSSNHFEGFNKTDDDHYQTPNFDSAQKKIFIKLDGGISDFKVRRY